jgi:hypothetical protein
VPVGLALVTIQSQRPDLALRLEMMALPALLQMQGGIFRQSHVVGCFVTDQLVELVLLTRKEIMANYLMFREFLVSF